MNKISVGDTILYEPWAGKPRTATVKQIEICKHGAKNGYVVDSCNMDLYDNGTLILCGNRWCYFYQVKQIIKNENNKENDPQILE